MAKAKTFEQSIRELERIVEKLEEGNVSLDEAIDLFQKGKALGKTCETRLKEIEFKIRKLSENAEGEPEAEDFEPAEAEAET